MKRIAVRRLWDARLLVATTLLIVGCVTTRAQHKEDVHGHPNKATVFLSRGEKVELDNLVVRTETVEGIDQQGNLRTLFWDEIDHLEYRHVSRGLVNGGIVGTIFVAILIAFFTI